MKKYSLLYLAFIAFFILGALHFVSLSYSLYWNIWWFDIVMHFLAGFALGFITVWFLFDTVLIYKRTPTTSESIFSALIVVLIIGISWEVFEYVNGLTQSTENYRLDVIHDIIADSVGAILAGRIAAKEIFRIRAQPADL